MGAHLLLVLWVGVWVIDDHSVRRLQVETSAGRADGQQEDERLAVLLVELLDGLLPAVHNYINKNKNKNKDKNNYYYYYYYLRTKMLLREMSGAIKYHSHQIIVSKGESKPADRLDIQIFWGAGTQGQT